MRKRNIRDLSLRFRNRKGDAGLDLLLIVIIIFTVSIGWIWFASTFTDINDDVQASDMSQIGKDNLAVVHDNYSNNFDGLVLFAFIGLSLFVIISAWFLDTHPVFFVIALLLFAIIIMVTVYIANTFSDIVESPDLVATSSQWVYTIWIMSHIVELLCVVAFFTFIVMYGKYRSG